MQGSSKIIAGETGFLIQTEQHIFRKFFVNLAT